MNDADIVRRKLIADAVQTALLGVPPLAVGELVRGALFEAAWRLENDGKAASADALRSIAAAE